MKKFFLLLMAASLFCQCSNTVSTNKKEKDSTTEDNSGKVDKKEPTVEHPTEGWSKEVQDRALKTCIEMQEAANRELPREYASTPEQSDQYCRCMLNKTMQVFASYDEMNAVRKKSKNNLTDKEKEQVEAMDKADEDCNKQSGQNGSKN